MEQTITSVTSINNHIVPPGDGWIMDDYETKGISFFVLKYRKADRHEEDVNEHGKWSRLVVPYLLVYYSAEGGKEVFRVEGELRGGFVLIEKAPKVSLWRRFVAWYKSQPLCMLVDVLPTKEEK